MRYTDDEVRAAIATTEECKVYSNANRMTRGELDAISWAASEYLKAKTVIEWYGASLTHSYAMSDVDGFNAYECDAGNKAREYLEKLNHNKGE